MAISTLDGALAGMQAPRQFVKALTGTLVAGRPHSYWGVAGSPGAGAWNGTLNGVALTGPVNGQLPRTDPGAGYSYLARLQAACTQPCTLVLADRLWHNQLTVNSTGLQSPTTPTWPARDVAAATAGDGVLLAIETSAAASATAAALTVTYTNQAGATGKTANFVDAPSAAATAAGALFRIGLAAGDTGVRAVTGVQFSTAWTTGTINLVAYRPIAVLELTAANISNAIDALTSGFPRIMDGSVPYFFIIPSATTSSVLSGSYVETQG